MMSKIINKKNIKHLLETASKDFTVYAPQKFMGGDVMFAPLPKEAAAFGEALAAVALGDEDTVISPKDVFFPQLESLFSFEDGKIKEVCERSPKLLFGVKPCDLKGILFADDFFKRDFEDKYYLSRAEERIIVSIGCLTPPRPQSCFCTSVKTGPFAEKGFDLQLVDAGDFYFVETGSEKGEEFVNKYESFFKDKDQDQTKAITAIKEKAAAALELKVDFEESLKLMSGDVSPFDEIYQRIAQRCIYCGACLYTCPTCTCFNVYDNALNNKGERARCWDACVFEGYTREASGHNPRKEKALRTARRYEHKLKYDYAATGMSGCVGCGRCLSSCPVNIGMSKFIQEITEKRKEANMCGCQSKNDYTPYPAKIEKVTQETSDTKTFCVRFTDNKLADSFSYQQGQFMEISVLGAGEVPISITSSPSRRGYLEFTIRATGKVTNAIHNLGIGDLMYLRGPYGNYFPYEELKGKNLYFIAGGIGLAPVRSLINLVMDNRKEFKHVKILYGAKTPDDMCFRQELQEWKKVPDTEVWLTVDKPCSGWGCSIGVVTELWKETKVHPENAVAVVCGPSIMIRFVNSKLVQSGFAEKDIIMTLERYMKCGIGKCGHCNVGDKFICIDGPIFSYEEVKNFPQKEGVF